MFTQGRRPALSGWVLFGLIIGTGACRADTSPTSTSTSNIPNRTDSISVGDKVKLQEDAPIFIYELKKPVDNKTGDANDAAETAKASKRDACAPAGSYFEVIQAPTATTTTTVTRGKQTLSETPAKGAGKTETTAEKAGDKITTETKNIAKVTMRRVGTFRLHKLDVQPKCGSPVGDGFDGVDENVTYELSTDDLASYRNHRFGWTYGGLVVPTKLQISDRSFTSSTSLFPYVGYENWATGVSGTVVLAAGLGTVPAQSSTPGSGTTTTRAVFSVATGEIFKFGTIFRAGVLVGTDTAGSKTGYKYQGRPWIGITLGAGS
jgi:hypothetical protein